MGISSKQDIKDYYKDKNLADGYTKARLEYPLGRYFHTVQARIINSYVKDKDILEMACGPARLSKEINGFDKALAMDSSEAMLSIAKTFLKGWDVKTADAFAFNLGKKFDVVYTFRFLRHFKIDDREGLYAQIGKHLKKGGYLIFDAVNYDKDYAVRKRKGFDSYKVYDKLYKKNELIYELKNNGFTDIKLYPCMNHLYTITLISKIFSSLKIENLGFNLIKLVEKIPSKNPLEWVVVCKKK